MIKKEVLKAVLYVLGGVILAFLIFTYSGVSENKTEDLDNGLATTTALISIKRGVWDDVSIPKIREEIGKNFMEITTEQSEKFSIYKKADITGDKIDEALVALGSGGAYTEYFALMQSDNNGNPKLARFRIKDGSTDDVLFLEGTSVSHGMSVELAPSKNAIYAESWNIDPINPDTISCEIEAYVWNKSSGLFEYNSTVGKNATDSYCSKITVSN